MFGVACGIGRRSLGNTAQVSLRNATLATLINYFPSASSIPGNAGRLEGSRNLSSLSRSSGSRRGSKARGWILALEFVVLHSNGRTHAGHLHLLVATAPPSVLLTPTLSVW